jgi:hypothetical protein
MRKGRVKAENFMRHLEPLQGALEAYCRRSLHDPNAVRDALQSAVANAFRDFHLYVQGTNFRAWIFRYAHLEAQNCNRKYAKTRHEELPIRVLSLYHGWLPFLLLWLVWRLGYDRRGWIVQTLLTWAILPICFFFTDPVRALNGVFGPSGEHPQTWVAPGLWLALMMVVYPLCVYLPTHLFARQVFREAPSQPGGVGPVH